VNVKQMFGVVVQQEILTVAQDEVGDVLQKNADRQGTQSFE
jgi:hypothetical protein